MNNRVLKAGLLLIILGLALSGCVMNKVSSEKEDIVLRQDGGGRMIRLDLETGDAWSRKMQAGPLVFNVLSQIVIWTEDEDGRLLETVYVSGADYSKMRHAGKNDKGEQFYRESFPLWARKMDEAGRKLPSPESPYVDSVTSATPSNDFSLETKMEKTNPPFSLFAEVNSAGDENEVFTKDRNDWVGQPALVYSARVTGQDAGYILELEGHSGLLDQEAALYTDLSAFDSALRQVKQIKLVITSE
jgi:hypothetical protein